MNGLLWAGLAFLISVLAAYVDDPLNGQAQALLASVPERTTDRSVFFRAGLNAPEGIDPAFYGRYRVETSLAHGQAYTSASLEGIESAALPAPVGPLFCSAIDEASCWPRIASVHEDQVIALQAEHATLLARYQAWLNMAPSHQRGPTSSSENLPVDHLAHTHRIGVLRALIDARQGQAEAASSWLRQGIMKLRQHLAAESDFSAKMLFTELLAESIDALSMISYAHGMNQVELEHLSPSEQDLTPSMANQFKMAHTFFMSPQGSAADRLAGPEKDPLPPAENKRLRRFVYKPISAVNLNYQDVRYWIDASRLKPQAFAELLYQPPQLSAWRVLGRFRNPVGHALLQLMEPHFKVPIAQLHALDIRIGMFNAVHVKPAGADPGEHMTNPYGHGLPSMTRAHPSAVCMPVPEVIDVKAVCLRLTG